MRILLAALLVLLAPATPARADERILRFSSDVQVRRDASLDVTETIEVRAENVSINRGIYRDFPTRYRGRQGSRVRIGFELESVMRNGFAEPAKVEPIRNGVRVRIGHPERVIEPGDHRYVIRYRTTRQIGRFDGFDELYWNATGNGWMFPIDLAEARIRLPSPVRFGQRAAYTGPQGSTATEAEVVAEGPGDIAFRTTRPLDRYEGLTVAVAFPKGVVAEADSGTQQAWWLIDYGPLLAAGAALLALFGYYYIAWARVGRNPRAGTIVPLFAPPDDLSPAAMRYVWKMGADNRAMAAALVDLGVKGHLRMSEEDGGFLSRDKVRLERLPGANPLSDAEEAMLREIAMTGESIVMEQANHKKFSSAKKALSDSLKKRFEGVAFHRNWGWAFAGVAFFLAGLWLTAAAITAAAGLVDWTMILVSFGALLATGLFLMLIQTASAAGKCLLWVVALVFATLAFTTSLPIVGTALQSGWWEPLAILAIGLPLVISAFFWIAAPTREGRALLDRIMGFRHYLSVAEAPRLDRMTAPAETPELFERYLPFAIALGVENRWADRFHDVLAAASAEGRRQFGWYSGSSSPWTNPGGFVSTVGSSLASTVSSASTAPGSSSGSGGGGSSGGGGGGGGGGGW